MKDQRTTILLNEPLCERVHRLRFDVDWEAYTPGQFVMVRVPGETVFLRRPFGIARLEGGVAEICYKVVGRGTARLAELARGAAIDVLGPCGKGFALPAADTRAVLVAGGYGIAPLLGLAKQLREARRDVHLFYGGRGKDDFFCVDELRSMGVDLVLATEDGSAGERGLVTEVLATQLDAIVRPVLMACGPEGMVRAVARFGLERGIPTQVSLDAYMACGIGVCLGCVCETAAGEYVRTCREGPVFRAEELKWEGGTAR